MLVYLKTCVCGKIMPYETDADKAFFDRYHSACTNDTSALDNERFF